MYFKQIIPSNKIIYSVFLLIVIISLLFLIKNNFKIGEKYKKDKINIENINKIHAIETLENKDTDGDGLNDWQEYLYKTDIEKEDTDGDGMSDFEEVQKERDPTIFGIGKQEKIIQIQSTQKKIIGIQDQKNEIEEYKIMLQKEEEKKFKIYYKNKTGNDLEEKTEEKEKKIFSLKEKRNKKIKHDLAKMADIIFPTEYSIGNKKIMKIAKLFSALPAKNNKRKIILLKVDKDDVKSVLNTYKNISNSLKKLKIKNLDVKYLNNDLIDSYTLLAKNLEIILKKIEDNDFSYIEAVKGYSDGIIKSGQTSNKIDALIKIYGIKFSNSENGRFFSYSM